MSTEIFMRKRRAKEGEIGLFVDSAVFEEEWSSIKVDAEVHAELAVPVHAKYRKFFHALRGKLADAVEWFNGDKDFAKEQLLLECRHVTYHNDRLRNKTEIRAKTTSNLDADGWIRLLRRANYVCVSKFMPGMAEGTLKTEIETMLGMGPLDLSAPAPKSQPKRQRAPRAPKEPLAEGQPNREEVVAETDNGCSVETRLPPADSLPPEGRPEGPAKVPTNEAEYVHACQSWLKKQTNRHVAFDYFNGEIHRKMRLDLKISTGTRKSLERQIGEFFDEQDKASKQGTTA